MIKRLLLGIVLFAVCGVQSVFAWGGCTVSVNTAGYNSYIEIKFTHAQAWGWNDIWAENYARWVSPGTVEYSIGDGEWKPIATFTHVYSFKTAINYPPPGTTCSVVASAGETITDITYPGSGGDNSTRYAQFRWRPSQWYITNLKIRVKAKVYIEGSSTEKSNTEVIWAGGGSHTYGLAPATKPVLHTPRIKGYEIQGDGRILVNTEIPGFTEPDDAGCAKLSLLESNETATISPQSITQGDNDLYVPRNRAQYSTSWSLKVKTARTDYYKLPYEAEMSCTRQDEWDNKVVSQNAKSDIFTIPPYPCPNDNSLQVATGNEKVTLTWTMPPGTAQSIVDDYKIKWRRTDGTDWADVKNENDESLAKAYDPTETNPSVTFPYPAKDEGTKEYEFLVTRGAFHHEEAEYNVTRSATFNTNRVAATPATAEIQEHDSTTVKVSWTLNDGRFSTNYRCRIYRKDGTKALVQVHEQPVAAGSTTVEWVDSFTVDCTPFYYEVRMFDGGDDVGGIGEYGQPFAKTGTLFMELRLNSIGAIANLSASKGYYDDKVLVKWDMTPRHRFKSFRLSRAIKNLAGAPTESLAEIPSGSVTNYMYEDKSAVQGIYYDYKVVGVTDCDGDIKEHSEKHSTGYKQPYGTVIGQIAFKSGSTSVVGATVTATTTPEAPNKAFEFTSDHQNYITTPIKASALSPSASTHLGIMIFSISYSV